MSSLQFQPGLFLKQQMNVVVIPLFSNEKLIFDLIPFSIQQKNRNIFMIIQIGR